MTILNQVRLLLQALIYTLQRLDNFLIGIEDRRMREDA